MAGQTLFSAGKRWIRRSPVTAGALRVASRAAGRSVAVLMYHSVVDNPSDYENTLGDIMVSTRSFRRQMEMLARQYHPVTLDDVLSFVEGRRSVPARSVVVTFDDGYEDNYEVAAPVLNGVGVPAAFYGTVRCMEEGVLPWAARLRHAFRTTGAGTWREAEDREWPLRSVVERDRAFLACCGQCARLTGQPQDRFVASIEQAFDSAPLRGPAMMTWDQARTLVRQGHIVGSHTMSHPNIAFLDEDAVVRELRDSKLRLEQELGAPVVHFSYPHPVLDPHWSTASTDVCRRLGYRTAVTTDPGPVRQGDDPLSLHRVTTAPDVDGLRWKLDCTFVGRAA